MHVFKVCQHLTFIMVVVMSSHSYARDLARNFPYEKHRPEQSYSQCMGKYCRSLSSKDITEYGLTKMGMTLTADKLTVVYTKRSSVDGQTIYCLEADSPRARQGLFEYIRFGRYVIDISELRDRKIGECPFPAAEIRSSEYGTIDDVRQISLFSSVYYIERHHQLERELSLPYIR